MKQNQMYNCTTLQVYIEDMPYNCTNWS